MQQQSTLTIHAEGLSVANLLKDFYAVPTFQREYTWKIAQIESLLDDLRGAFYNENNELVQDHDAEYFLGSIVVCDAEEEGVFSLIDGQQRMTTIYIFLCAARDALVQAESTAIDVIQRQLYSSRRVKSGAEEHRYRLTLQYAASQDCLERLASPDHAPRDDTNATQSIKHILDAYDYCRTFISSVLDNDPSNIDQFLWVFTERIKIIRILTPTVTNALRVFETINARGVGLTPMDLLKNLLFMNTTDEASYSKLTKAWEKMSRILEKCGEKPLRFLRYYIMSHYDIDHQKGIREDEIYTWFAENERLCGIASSPVHFAEALQQCAEVYAKFVSATDPSGEDNRYLDNISVLGRTLRQHFILLLAGRHLPPKLFNRLCCAIEKLFFCYIVTREPTKVFEKTFARWASELRSCRSELDLDEFLSKHFEPDMAARSGRFTFEFDHLTENNIQKYRLKYVLAKLSQHIDEQAWDNPGHQDLRFYTNRFVHVEHILPRTPPEHLRQSFDKPEEYDTYVSRLGNLTLLEGTSDSSISNKSYDVKSQTGYAESKFLLTQSLFKKPKLGAQTKLDKAVSQLRSFKEWNSKSIDERQAMLTRLAHEVWDVPVVQLSS